MTPFDQPNQTPKLAIVGRRDLLGSLLMVPFIASGCVMDRRSRVATILFVCEFGTAKSAISREIMRARARERGLTINVNSRGLKVEDHLTAELRTRLARDGIDPTRETPRVLRPADWQSADIVVAFNTLPGSVPRSKIRDWTDLPSIVSDYDRARSILDRRIDVLLDEFGVRSSLPA